LKKAKGRLLALLSFLASFWNYFEPFLPIIVLEEIANIFAVKNDKQNKT